MRNPRALVALVWLLLCAVVHGQAPATPQLTVVGDHFEDPTGHRVILRGVASMGMGMVYGDKGNPGTYLGVTPTQYIDRATGTDGTGNKWYSTAIRLNFERFPSTNPSRLYATENQPWGMPDTIAFSAWQASHSGYADGDVVTNGGFRWRVIPMSWRADKSAGWNPGLYQVGDRVVGLNADSTRIYECMSVTGSGPSGQHWERGPTGTGTGIVENQDAVTYTWDYVGVFGTSGTTAPSSLTPISAFTNLGTLLFYVDNRVTWVKMSTDYDSTTAEANFAAWKAAVMDPVVNRAIANSLYVIICEFDFGPAHHPLRLARMLDFWPRMANDATFKNNPQVIFELWNESEDIGSYAGGAGSWAAQKSSIQSVINAIRATGANNIIVVPPPFYSAWVGEATASPLTGSNLAYAMHQYDVQWDAYSSNRDQVNQGLASGYPIVVTEWGDNTARTSGACDGGPGGETDPNQTWPYVSGAPPSLRVLLEPSLGSTHPAAGWFAWALTKDWCPALFQNNTLTDPTVFGIATRQWLFEMRNDSQPTGGGGGGSGGRGKGRIRMRGKDPVLVAAVIPLWVMWRLSRRKGSL